MLVSDEVQTFIRRVADVAASLSDPQRAMLARARREWLAHPPRCYGPTNTRKALRDRGLAHGDCCYLTPFGIEVRKLILDDA